MSEETAWVIERDIHSRLYYWNGGQHPRYQWSTSHMDAMRFARRTDAECMLTWHCEGIGRIVEHKWMKP